MAPPRSRSSLPPMPPPLAPSRRQATRAHSDSYHPIYSSSSSSSSASSSAGSDASSIFSHESSASSATSDSPPRRRTIISKAARIRPPQPRPGTGPPMPPSISVSLCSPETGKTTFILPRALARPKPQSVSPAALAAAGTDLDKVPLPYIIQSLKDIGPRMMAALGRTKAPTPAALPRDLDILVSPDPDPDPELDTLPTHLLAVYARSKAPVLDPAPRRKVTLFPTHAVMLAAHCAHLPPLPPGGKTTVNDSEDVSPMSLDGEQSGQVTGQEDPSTEPEHPPPLPETEEDAPPSYTKRTLPVVPLCIPAPKLFPVLQAYLYTKRADHLLGALIPNTHPPTSVASTSPPTPLPTAPSRQESPSLSLGAPSPPVSESDSATPRPSPAPSTPTQTSRPLPGLIPDSASLAAQLATAHTSEKLVSAALRTHGLWANAAALGVFDERLWLTIDFAWRVLLGALERGPAVEEDSNSDSDEKDDESMFSGLEAQGVQVEDMQEVESKSNDDS